jgi:hypothetical protein
MPEQRRHFRPHRFETGKIYFGSSGGIDCSVRNTSPTSACLEIDTYISIPDKFDLVIKAEHLNRSCVVVCRNTNRFGVRFA